MEELKCPQCLKQYSDSNPPRLLTMCGHTYCQLCLKSIIRKKQNRYQIRCPHDKMRMMLQSASPLQFPRNMVLVETLNKGKSKGDHIEEGNEFLPNNGQTVTDLFCRPMSHTLKSSLALSRRRSHQENICLLHQKPLDIICLQEKISICAECALFGMHKEHSFTTIRDIESKRSGWIGQISAIIEEKSALEHKMSEKKLKGHLNGLVEKRKMQLTGEVHQHYNIIREALVESQDRLIQQIEESLKKMERQIIEKAVANSEDQHEFKQWQNSILSTIIYLESTDIIKSLDIFADLLLKKEDHFIQKGNQLLDSLKQQNKNIQDQIQIILSSPQLHFESNIKQILQSFARLQERKEDNRSTIIDELKPQQSFTTNYCLTETENEDVSLLDIRDDISNINLSAIHFFPPSKQNDLSKSHTSTLNTLPTHSQIQSKAFKKSKIKYLSINKSTASINDNIRNTYMSPNFKRKKQPNSKGTIVIPSTTNNKDKLKRAIFKVKDPEKFNKILKALEMDSAESVDFTGLQLGNQLAKDLFPKLKESSKVRNVRMMKNNLSDETLPFLCDALDNIEVLNLAQNNFSIKILDQLLEVFKSKPPQKQKNIQLGQNNINKRKCKDKIEKLRQLGIMISL